MTFVSKLIGVRKERGCGIRRGGNRCRFFGSGSKVHIGNRLFQPPLKPALRHRDANHGERIEEAEHAIARHSRLRFELIERLAHRHQTDDLLMAARQPQVFQRKGRARIDEEFLALDRIHGGRDLGLRGQLRDPGQHELRRVDLQRRVHRWQSGGYREAPAPPRETVEELFRQILLQNLVEVARTDQSLRDEDLGKGLAGGGALGEDLEVGLLGDVPSADHELAQRVMQQVRLAIDGRAVLQDDLLRDLPAIDREHHRAMVNGKRVEQDGKRDLGEVSPRHLGDCANLFFVRDH